MEERLMPYIKRPERVSPSVMAALASAVFEWFLIFLLFIDASFSYFITKFARYCNLQIPCLLCSRLDHILGKERAGFYWDLICQKHKLKISSLVLCHLHSKLVDVQGMCESCLFSFATINKSNTETYRLLVGKLGASPPLAPDEDPLLGGHSSGSLESRSCSCCNKKWISRGYAARLFQAKSIEPKGTELDKTLSVTVGDDRDDLKMIRDETYRAGKVSPSSVSNFDPLPHVEYRKVKITSDSESEASISDDESARLLLQEENAKKDLGGQCLLPDPQIITLADDRISEKLILTASASPEVKLEDTDSQSTTADAAAPPVGHGLEELKGQQIKHTTAVSASPELIYFDEVLPSSQNVACSTDASETYAKGKAEQGAEEIQNCGDSKVASQSIPKSEAQLNLKPDTSETSLQMPNSLDLGDAYKIALGTKGRQLSGKLLEQRSLKESARASEDFKLLLSQLSASRGIEISLTDMSPRVSGNIDELRACDASSSVGMKILQKRISLERNESGLSLDGSTVSEIEGESVVDRLKRQVEHDTKLMSALYKELEEERNASAVAANQAMAMITRLQEEKATLHMEAFQCLRMMEEQAEYDVEALQKANNLLEEKEKEVQDQAAKLELYMIKFGQLSILEDLVEPCSDPILGELGVEDVVGNLAKSNTSIISSSNSDKHDICGKMNESTKSLQDNNAENILVEFKGERLYLLQCLRKLDKELQLFCHDKVHLEKASADFSVQHSINQGIPQRDGEMHEDHMQKGTVICDGRPCADGESASTYNYTEQAAKEDADWKPGKHVRGNDLEILRKEFSLLSSRLEALETETSFLKHSFNSLKNGDEGLKCIEEVACCLRDLHLSISRRC